MLPDASGERVLSLVRGGALSNQCPSIASASSTDCPQAPNTNPQTIDRLNLAAILARI